MRARDERHQIAKNARDSFDGFWDRFPTFWSAEQTDRHTINNFKKKAESGFAVTKEEKECLLEFIDIFTPQGFQSMNDQNRNVDQVAFSYPFFLLYTRAN